MPVHKAKGGYKFGKSGKTYRGKGAKKKCRNRQGRYMQVDIGRERGNEIRNNKNHWLYNILDILCLCCNNRYYHVFSRV